MGTSTSNMQITKKGLTEISKELINKRTYDKTKITIIGNPSVSSSGVASYLSQDDYFKHDNLSFNKKDEIKINFAGTFVESSGTARGCAWSLTSTEVGYDPISINCFSNKVSFMFGNAEIGHIGSLIINDDDSIKIETIITETSYSISLLHNDTIYYVEGVTASIDLSKYTSIFIGNYAENSTNFWAGSINLPSFMISIGYTVYYSPSIENFFNFTKMLISDGVYPLTDISGPIRDHIYEFPIEEIAKNPRSVLLKVTIDKDTYLKIREIGLYCASATENYLFSTMDKISIDKTKGLGYDLIIHVNLELNVVNAGAYPTIVLEEKPKITKKDFDTVSNSYECNIADLERVIIWDATKLGYNRAQTLCRLQDSLSLIEQNCTAAKTFKKLKKDSSLSDYFFVPNYKYSAFRANNLNNMENSYLRVLEEAIDSVGDSVDFKSPTGFTMALKVDLKDTSNKVILSKVDLENEDTYFELSMSIPNPNTDPYPVLSFKLYLETSTITLSRKLDNEILREFISNPILLTIIKSGTRYNPTYTLYKNNTVFCKVENTPTDYIGDLSEYKLTNYLTEDTVDEANNCIQGIYTFNKALSKDELYTLNNLLDTNFDASFIISVKPEDGVSTITNISIEYKGQTIVNTSGFKNENNVLTTRIIQIAKGDTIIIKATGFRDQEVALLDPVINVELLNPLP